MDGMLDSLLNTLQKVEYQSEYSGSKFMINVINEKHMPLIKTAVVEWYDMYFGSEYARKIGELEAKVYAYEQIIANNNFAPMLQFDEDKGENRYDNANKHSVIFNCD